MKYSSCQISALPRVKKRIAIATSKTAAMAAYSTCLLCEDMDWTHAILASYGTEENASDDRVILYNCKRCDVAPVTRICFGSMPRGFRDVCHSFQNYLRVVRYKLAESFPFLRFD